MDRISHLHRGALRAHAGEGKVDGRVWRAHAYLGLRYRQCPSRNDTEKIVGPLADLRGVVLNRNRTAGIHRRERVGSPAALRTMSKTKSHATSTHPPTTRGVLFGRTEIRFAIPTDSSDRLFHEIEIIGV